MADDQNPMNATEQAVTEVAASGGEVSMQQAMKPYEPIYKMVGSAKVPVSKATGNLWKARRDAAAKKLKGEVDRWMEAFRYFDNDQYKHRNPRDGTSGNIEVSMRRNKIHSETENIIYANIMMMVPALYAKNPNGEITGYNNEQEPILRIGERLIKALCQMKVAPGFNLRSKAKRCVVSTLLTNEAWMIYGYTLKEESSEQALTELNSLAEQLEKAKDTKEIQEIEGKLMALEEATNFLTPAGPIMKVMQCKDMLIDPDCSDEDFNDAKWGMYPLLLPTSYIRAKYGEKDESDRWMSIYQPTNVLDASSAEKKAEHEDFDTMALFEEGKEHAAYGFDTQEAFDRSCYTKVWYVWDKITRRLYMFNDADWKWPIWVFNDPYGLPGFFPFKKLSFNTHPYKLRSRGEVSFYLDQQDALNEINDESNRIRKALKFKVIYNKDLVKDPAALDAFFDSDTQKAYGVELPEGRKIDDLFMAPPFPALQHKEFFVKDNIYSAIDRIAGTSEIMRGAQFKTNTTNKAIENYNSILNQKIDEKIDAIEEFIGDILGDILFLCIKFMPTEEVVRIIGIGGDVEQQWEQFKSLSQNKMINYRVVGGSTQKPTSAAKKKEALEMGQILGQFASASPAVLLTVLKMFEKAFDDFIISAEDWELIQHSIMTAIQGQQEQPEQPQGTTGQAEGHPQAEDLVQRLVQKGIPETVARARVRAKLGATNAGPQQQSAGQ